MKLCSLVLELHLLQNFCHTQTDRHFPKMVKSCSRHPKTCKSIKLRKSKICTKPILSFTYIEESKKHGLTDVSGFYWPMTTDIKGFRNDNFLIIRLLADFESVID